MKKAIKWVLIVGGGLVALVLLSLLIIPQFVDVQQYKPEIEKRVSEATGRPFTLGGDLGLSLFPWVGLSFSDLHLGNPPGFKEKDLVAVKSFEVRVKLIPLLFKDIQVKRFILEEPRIVLERRKDGRGNWEGMGKPSGEVSDKVPEEKKGAPDSDSGSGLPIKSLAVGEFAIRDGSVLWIDHVNGERRELSDLTLRLEDVSLDRPIELALSVRLEGNPLSLEGKVGPVGKEPGKGTIPLDLAVQALKQLEISLKGKIVDPLERLQFDLALQVSPFSPRKLVADLGQTFPIKTADPKVLDHVALKVNLKGDPETISVSDGTLDLDESRLTFSVKAKDFSRPDVTFDLSLDEIDADRYLPPAGENKPVEEKEKTEAPAPEQKKMDYTPLRRLVLDGAIRVGKLKAHGVRLQDVNVKVAGKNGYFHVDPLTLKLYQGDVSSKGALDVRQDVPKSSVQLDAQGIQVSPLLKDLLEKDFLEGTVQSTVVINLAGDDPEKIRSTLNGKGDLLFKDGAIVGIDLAGMVRNVKATFGLSEKGGERPRTDFSELHAPFTITNGVVNTPGTSLMSPLIRVLAAGDADLMDETLDFRVEPKFVGTIKGQGDTMQHSGLMVPVLVTGTFSSPKFRPDLKGMLKKGLEEGLPQPSELKKILPGESMEEGESKPLEEQAKDLLKGLPFGR
ncbi:MAG: AsmA family protein [Desulfobacteria bacterium]